MPLKLQTVEVEGQTYAKLKDGKPLYVEDSNNTEVAYDAEASTQTIRNLNGEAKRNRELKDELEKKLAPFSDIDPEAARKALETVANLDGGALLTAGKVEELKAGIVDAANKKWEGQVKSLTESNSKLTEDNKSLTANLHSEKLGNAFAISTYIKDKMILQPDAVQRIFANQFKIEDNKIVAYHANGTKVFSQQRPGQDPEFDEAIEIVVGESKYRDDLLKGNGNKGGGGDGGGSQHFRAGEKKILRSEFDALPSHEKAKRMREGFTVVDTP